MSNYRDQLEAYLKTLDVQANMVFDIGGAANPIRNRVKTWQVKRYEIYDNHLEETQVEFHDFDLNKNIATQDLPMSYADIIFCLEVMEYIYDPHEAIKIFSNMLWKDGFLYITFPFLYPIHEPKQADFLRYTADGIARLLGEFNFKILEIIPRTMTPEGFIFWKQFLKAEGMHASKHSRHDILGWIVKAQLQ